MFTYGFYSSINHDRTYSAEQMCELMDGVINDGVFQNIGTYMVVEEGTGMQINVGIGRAWFNGTWSLNDSLYPLMVEEAPYVAGFSRIDAVVIKVEKDESARMNSLVIIKGQESSSTPVKPVLDDTETTFYHPLAYITVKHGDTEIKQSQIQNVVGTDETPFVTGILETASLSNLLIQWEAQWNEWLAMKKDNADATWEEFTKHYSDVWQQWYEEITHSEELLFSNWFENIKGQLSTDAAGHLQNQIDRISNIYVVDNILYLPNTAASVTSDGTLVLGPFNDKEEP